MEESEKQLNSERGNGESERRRDSEREKRRIGETAKN